MAEKFLEAGRIVGTHGIQGELKVENYTDSPQWLKKIKTLYFNKGETDAKLISSRVHKNHLLIKLEGIDSIESGTKLYGTILYMNRDDIKLPKNRFFIVDLIGLKVYDGNNEKYYGTITDVFATGANNVYKIENNGKEYLFPAVDHMIKRTDIQGGIIEVYPIPGIFDDEVILDANWFC